MSDNYFAQLHARPSMVDEAEAERMWGAISQAISGLVEAWADERRRGLLEELTELAASGDPRVADVAREIHALQENEPFGTTHVEFDAKDAELEAVIHVATTWGGAAVGPRSAHPYAGTLRIHFTPAAGQIPA